MVLETISALCTSGSCPTVYRSDRGTVVVQGYVVTPEQAGLRVPDGEQLVEIPIEVLTSAARTVA